MRRSLRPCVIPILICAVVLGQTPVQVAEPAAQARKLLNYAAKMDNLDPITAVQFAGKPFMIAKRTRTVIKVTGLASAGASATAKTQDITLVTWAARAKSNCEWWPIRWR